MKAILVASFFAIACLAAPASAQDIEYGIDRPGFDIGNFSLPPNGSPENCQGACQANQRCVAWTFVRSGWQGPAPRCWLKNQVPQPNDSACCVSGVK
jgi:hypothetical protein